MIFFGKWSATALYATFLLICVFPARAQLYRVEVCFTNIKKVGGKLEVGLYNNPRTFPVDDQEYKDVQVPVNSDSICYTFSLPAGQYAIAVYHDVNNNDKIDRNLIGRPTEQYGFSNNARPFLSAPKFKEAAFWVKQDTVVVIRLF